MVIILLGERRRGGGGVLVTSQSEAGCTDSSDTSQLLVVSVAWKDLAWNTVKRCRRGKLTFVPVEIQWKLNVRLLTGHWRKTFIYTTCFLKIALVVVLLLVTVVYILFLRPSFWYFCLCCTTILILLCSFILLLLKSRVYFEVPALIQEISKRFFFS